MNDNILYHALARPRDPRPAPPFPLVSSVSFGSARSRPGREAAKRTLDGEDRFDTMKREGKGGDCRRDQKRSLARELPWGRSQRRAAVSGASQPNPTARKHTLAPNTFVVSV